MKINTLIKDIITTLLVLFAFSLTLCCVIIGIIKYDLFTFVIGIAGFNVVLCMIDTV